jgi:hypothetical protein
MRKSKISGSGRKTRSIGATLKPHRFLGLALCGGKTNKTCLAVLEYYPQHQKLFLTRLYDKMESSDTQSSDAELYNILHNVENEADLLAYNVPFQLPKCLRCEAKCPGYEKCNEPEIKWLWKAFKKKSDKKKNTRLFTPYTERCSEYYISMELEEAFYPSHAMGANSAPLLARALFLQRRLKMKAIEVYPKLSLWRIGQDMNMQKSHLRYHKHAFGGEESRAYILKEFTERNLAFIYEQDRKTMVDNNYAFEAFLSALTGFLKYMDQCEKRPSDFPKTEAWIEFPKEDIKWHTGFGGKTK